MKNIDDTLIRVSELLIDYGRERLFALPPQDSCPWAIISNMPAALPCVEELLISMGEVTLARLQGDDFEECVAITDVTASLLGGLTDMSRFPKGRN